MSKNNIRYPVIHEQISLITVHNVILEDSLRKADHY